MRKRRTKKLPHENAESAPTLIGANMSFEGRLKGKDSVCIEGEFKGILESGGSVYVNKKAKVEADIAAQNVFVHGEVRGNIAASEHLSIGASGRIKGDVEIRSLTVITGGFLEGTCKMKTKNETIELDKASFEEYQVGEFHEITNHEQDGITEDEFSSDKDIQEDNSANSRDNKSMDLLDDIVAENDGQEDLKP